MPLKYDLRQIVKIRVSGEHGEVIGRAEYIHCEPMYLLRYMNAKGAAVEAWWSEGALENA